jgi:hypothetical protein
MYRVLGLLGLEVLGLTPVLILDVVLERLRFDSYFTLGSTLMLVFFGVEVLVGAWTGCLSFMEDFEAATDGFFTSSRIVLAACSALDGGRVSAGFPLASDEAFVALPEMVLPLVTVPLGPVLFASAESWSIDNSTPPTLIVILVVLLVAIPGSEAASLCLRFLPLAT